MRKKFKLYVWHASSIKHRKLKEIKEILVIIIKCTNLIKINIFCFFLFLIFFFFFGEQGLSNLFTYNYGDGGWNYKQIIIIKGKLNEWDFHGLSWN